MAEKTVWEHVLDEPVASPPGERPMKAQLDARFDGSFKQLCEWMQETFKNPDDLRVRVIVGNFPLTNEIIPTPEPTYSAEAHKLATMATCSLSVREAEDVLKKVRRIGQSQSKIQGIKTLREATNMGLKEAKDFFEALPPVKDEEEIPF